ncbi:hypothetical protein [Xanthomonas translucens]|uniref:hypothetical protein n=1 Tax=Xanthomonas campestris pv. translucens TaxID=343 RepID=UPI003CCEA6E7
MLAEILLQPEPYPALQGGFVQRGGGGVVEVEQAACVGQQYLARLGQRQLTATAAQQCLAGLVFQLLPLRADRGRGTPLPICRLGEAAQLDAGDEAAQRIEVEGDATHAIDPVLSKIGC